MTVIYNMSIDRADKPWIGDRRLTECRWMVDEMPPGRFFASPESNKNLARPCNPTAASRFSLALPSPRAARTCQGYPFRFAVTPP